MTLHSSQIGGVSTASAALKSTTSESKKSTATTSFSAALKDASTTAETGTTSKKKAPAGEKTRAVEGHKYADITAGPRKGLFLNTGSNERAGEAFVMVKKNGREYHIYGTGENRRVIGLKTAEEKKNDAVSTDNSTATTDTTTSTPVDNSASTTG